MGAGGMQGGGGGFGGPPRGGPGGRGGFGNPQNYQQNFMQRFGLMGQQPGPAGPGGGKPAMPGGYPQPLTSLFPMQQGGFPQQSGGLGGLAGLAGLGGPQTQQAAMNQNQQMLQQQGQGQLTPEAARQLFLQQSSPINQTTQADIMGQSGQPQPGYDRPLFETQMRQQHSLAPQMAQASQAQLTPEQLRQLYLQQQGQAPQSAGSFAVQKPAGPMPANPQMGQSGQAPQPGMDQAFQDFLAQQNFVSQRPDGMMIQKPAGPMPANPMAVPQQVAPEAPGMQAMRMLQRISGR